MVSSARRLGRAARQSAFFSADEIARREKEVKKERFLEAANHYGIPPDPKYGNAVGLMYERSQYQMALKSLPDDDAFATLLLLECARDIHFIETEHGAR